MEDSEYKKLYDVYRAQKVEIKTLQEKVASLEDAYNTLECDHFDAVKRAEQAEQERDTYRLANGAHQDELIKAEQENKEAMDLLDNVLYWETCPQEYVDRILTLQGRLPSNNTKEVK